MITYHVRRATDRDLEACFELRRLAEESFRTAGLDQWHDSEEGRRVITKWVERDAMHVVTTHAGDIVACFAIGGADQDFWTEEEATEPAIYIYKIIIRPDRKGTGLGDAILDWACDYGMFDAPAPRPQWLRVDCWKNNTGLHRYFENRGFSHVATRTAPGRNSGWLAQRPINQRTNINGPVLTSDEPEPVSGGDRYDDPRSEALIEARNELASINTHLDGVDIGAQAAVDQAVRAIDVLAREKRQENGMTHRPYNGQ